MRPTNSSRSATAKQPDHTSYTRRAASPSSRRSRDTKAGVVQIFIHSDLTSISAVCTLKYPFCLQRSIFRCPGAVIDLSREMDTPSERSHSLDIPACVPAVDTGTRLFRLCLGLAEQKRSKPLVSDKTRLRSRSDRQVRQAGVDLRDTWLEHGLPKTDLSESSRVGPTLVLSQPSGCDIRERWASARISAWFAGLNPPLEWDPACVPDDRDANVPQA